MMATELDNPALGIHCPTCGYDLRGLDLPRACPECGKRVTPTAVEAINRQIQYGEGAPIWFVASVMIAIGAGVLSAVWYSEVPGFGGFRRFLSSFFFVAVTGALGAAPIPFLHPSTRAAALKCWFKPFPVLHLGWMFIPLMILLLSYLPLAPGSAGSILIEMLSFVFIPGLFFMPFGGGWAWVIWSGAEREKAGLAQADRLAIWQHAIAIMTAGVALFWSLTHFAALAAGA